MRRAGWIFLALVLVLAGGNTVCAQDGFYVIPVKEKNNVAPVPKTGQTTSYGPRDDGALQKGVAWPNPRFTDHGNGAVTDNLTGLIWTKNANAFGYWKKWNDALDLANNLKSGDAGLTDGSKAGDWRLPNIRELQSLIDCGSSIPALPVNHPFTNVQMDYYWSSTSSTTALIGTAWFVNIQYGNVGDYAKNSYCYVWCVRDGPL